MARRPSAAQLRARAAFVRRFGGHKSAARPKVRRMARFARVKKYARAAGSRARRGFGGRGLLAPAVAGAAVQYTGGMAGGFGAPLTNVAVGMFMGDDWTQKLGAYQLGAMVGRNFLPGTNGGGPNIL